MNRNILLAFTMMIIALVGLGVASTADNCTVNDVEINDAVIANETADSINDIDNEVVANETEDSKDCIIKANDTIIYDAHPDGENNGINKVKYPFALNLIKTPSNYELIRLYFNIPYKYHKAWNIDQIVPVIREMDDMYETGHSCKEISEYANMTPKQVQYIVDNHLFKPLDCDKLSYSVYTLCGTGSLEELAEKIDVSQDDVYNKVMQIKSGYYGIDYRDLFNARDRLALISGHSDLVINNKEYSHN